MLFVTRCRPRLTALTGLAVVLIVAGSAFARQQAAAPVPASDAPIWPATSVYDEGAVFISPGRVFEPLIADPRWPRFSAFYNYYAADQYLEHMGTVSLGESLAVYRDVTDAGNLWEAGLQGSIYGVYDIGEGNNLYNTDWYFSVYYAYRRDDLSLLVRTYHDSGHLGDEFIVKNPDVPRENFVLDGGQVLLSYDIDPTIRLYGGPAWYWSTSEDVEDSILFQWGLELESPHTIWNGLARPIAAADVQHWEGRDYVSDLSVRFGLRFEQPNRIGSNVSLLAEYYTGRERNGQFIKDNVQYVGFGVQFQL
jgi:hypothetical protein